MSRRRNATRSRRRKIRKTLRRRSRIVQRGGQYWEGQVIVFQETPTSEGVVGLFHHNDGFLVYFVNILTQTMQYANGFKVRAVTPMELSRVKADLARMGRDYDTELPSLKARFFSSPSSGATGGPVSAPTSGATGGPAVAPTSGATGGPGGAVGGPGGAVGGPGGAVGGPGSLLPFFQGTYEINYGTVNDRTKDLEKIGSITIPRRYLPLLALVMKLQTSGLLKRDYYYWVDFPGESQLYFIDVDSREIIESGNKLGFNFDLYGIYFYPYLLNLGNFAQESRENEIYLDRFDSIEILAPTNDDIDRDKLIEFAVTHRVSTFQYLGFHSDLIKARNNDVKAVKAAKAAKKAANSGATGGPTPAPGYGFTATGFGAAPPSSFVSGAPAASFVSGAPATSFVSGAPKSGFTAGPSSGAVGGPSDALREMRYRTFMGGLGGGRSNINTSKKGRGRVTHINGKKVIDYAISSHGGYPARGSPSFKVDSNAEIVFYSDHGSILSCPNIVQTQICWQGKESAVYERYEPTVKCPDYTLTSDRPRLSWLSGVIDCNVSNTKYIDKSGKAAPIINLDDTRRGRVSNLSDVVDEIMQYHRETYGNTYFARIHCLFCRYIEGGKERTTTLESVAFVK